VLDLLGQHRPEEEVLCSECGDVGARPTNASRAVLEFVARYTERTTN